MEALLEEETGGARLFLLPLLQARRQGGLTEGKMGSSDEDDDDGDVGGERARGVRRRTAAVTVCGLAVHHRHNNDSAHTSGDVVRNEVLWNKVRRSSRPLVTSMGDNTQTRASEPLRKMTAA